MSQIERREFLIRGTAATAAAGIVLAPAVAGHRSLLEGAVSVRQRLDARPAPIAVLRVPPTPSRLSRAFARLGGVGCRGRSVLLKPTLAYLRGPGRAGNVQPEVLRSVLALLLKEGATRVVVCDRTAAPAHLVYARSGAMEVVRELGDRRVELVSLEEDDFVPVRRREKTASRDPEAKSPLEELGALRVARHLIEADVVVGLAAARRGSARDPALAIANLRGLFGGGEADGMWEKRRYLELSRLAALVRPEWTILDATATDASALAVSRDLLGVEAFGAELIGLDPRELPWLEAAQALGLGSPELAPTRIFEG